MIRYSVNHCFQYQAVGDTVMDHLTKKMPLEGGENGQNSAAAEDFIMWHENIGTQL